MTVGARDIVLVTGLSGAGRTTALKVLEDMGDEAIDNLPLSLLGSFLSAEALQSPAAADAEIRPPVAIGLDIRSRNFSVDGLIAEIDRLKARSDIRLSVLFLDCEDDTLLRRYSETRRRHPLAAGRPLREGIVLERQLLVPVRERADLVVDTTHLQARDLRRQLQGHFGENAQKSLSVFVTSFAYRRGLPRDADLVFDVRFLANPHYDPELRPLTGQDRRIQGFVTEDPGFAPFFGHLTMMLSSLLPRYNHEGKSTLTIAIGCTGGRHRSVTVAERLAEWMRREGHGVIITHRDIGAAAHG